MIRFRLGQRWKRERAAPPTDSFGLELDGVELLPEASDEPLGASVEGLLESVSALVRGERFAQISLPEARLELVLARRGERIELAVASLGRPARLAKPKVEVGLEDLKDAALRLGRFWLSELATGVDPDGLARAATAALVSTLEASPIHPPERIAASGGFGYERFPRGFGLGFHLWDPDDLLLSYRRAHGPSLGALMFDGELSLRLGQERLKAQTPALFLALLELSRQAVELQRAIELEERELELALGGVLPTLRLRLGAGAGSVRHRTFALSPGALVQELWEVGLELTFAVTLRNPLQAHNAYVAELAAQCRQGLARLRRASPASEPGSARPRRRRAGAAEKPLAAHGRLRRLRFAKLWSEKVTPDESVGCLLLGRDGPLTISRAGVDLFSAKGARVLHRDAPLGAAALPDGSALCAYPDRLVGYAGADGGARWFRPHDGVPLDLEPLTAADGLWMARSEGRSVLALDAQTGREVWRVSPPATHRTFLTVQAHRAVLATDSGHLYGLDLKDALVRFRMRSPQPFGAPTVPWGRRLVAVTRDGDHSVLTVIDAHSGRVVWTEHLPLRNPCVPVARGSTLYVAGEYPGSPLLLALGPRGKRLWHRPLPLDPGPLLLRSTPTGPLLLAASGAVAKVSISGEVEWRLGAASAGAGPLLAPVLCRGVLFVPGEVIRAVDPKSGNVLAEVAVGPGLCGLKADARLTLYALTDTGLLQSHRLSTQLSVVDG